MIWIPNQVGDDSDRQECLFYTEKKDEGIPHDVCKRRTSEWLRVGHSRESGNPESLEVCLEIRSGSPIKEFGDDSCVEFGDDICVEFGDDKLPIGSPIKDFGDDSCVEFGDDSCVEFGDDKKWL